MLIIIDVVVLMFGASVCCSYRNNNDRKCDYGSNMTVILFIITQVLSSLLKKVFKSRCGLIASKIGYRTQSIVKQKISETCDAAIGHIKY